MDDIQPVIEAIQNDELPGTPIEGVDSKNKTYKVRAVNSSTNVGESNGFRIIYYAVMADGKAYLLTIYSKKDDRMIPSKKEIRDILKILDSV